MQRGPGNPVDAALGRARREQILEFIRSYLAEHGYPPSRAEIGDEIGVSGTQISKHLRMLQEQGMVRLGSGNRTIALVDKSKET